MKKILSLVFVLVFVLGLIGTSFANVQAAQQELTKVRKYLNTLDGKIAKARELKDLAKIDILKELKRNAMARAKTIKESIARANRKAPKPLEGGWRLQGGYGAGAAVFRLGYLLPPSNINILIDAGYALGNQYNIVLGGISFILPQANDRYFSFDLLSATYSQTVADIPGLSQIAQGSNTGLGIGYGFPFRGFTCQLGYNSALGVTANLVRQF